LVIEVDMQHIAPWTSVVVSVVAVVSLSIGIYAIACWTKNANSKVTPNLLNCTSINASVSNSRIRATSPFYFSQNSRGGWLPTTIGYITTHPAAAAKDKQATNNYLNLYCNDSHIQNLAATYFKKLTRAVKTNVMVKVVGQSVRTNDPTCNYQLLYKDEVGSPDIRYQSFVYKYHHNEWLVASMGAGHRN
jgi:hypothetical protein